MPNTPFLMLVGLALVAPVAAPAQAPPTGSVETLLNCSAIDQESARLTCFDREASQLRQAIAKRHLVVLDRGEVRRTRRSLFGFSLPSMKMFGNGETKAETAEVAKLDTRITSVRRASGYGLYLLTLAEGGTWQTIEANRNFEPVTGQTIVIERGLIGNYNAKVDGGRAVRVKRVG